MGIYSVASDLEVVLVKDFLLEEIVREATIRRDSVYRSVTGEAPDDE